MINSKYLNISKSEKFSDMLSDLLVLILFILFVYITYPNLDRPEAPFLILLSILSGFRVFLNMLERSLKRIINEKNC